MSDMQFHPAWPEPANSASDIDGPKKHNIGYPTTTAATTTATAILGVTPVTWPFPTTATSAPAVAGVSVPVYPYDTAPLPCSAFTGTGVKVEEMQEAYSKVVQSDREIKLEKALDVVKASQTATTGGRKFDGGKLQYGLLPVYALEENVKVLTVGAEKYEPDNWKRVPDGPRRYFDAALRHLFAHKRGETNDPETGLNHLAHALCCIQFILDLELAEKASKVPPKAI